MNNEWLSGQQQELSSVEQVKEILEETEKGKVSNAAVNYKRVLQLDPLLKGAIRKNLLTERVDIVKPLGWYRDSPTVTDIDIKYLLLYFEENYGLGNKKKIQDAVTMRTDTIPSGIFSIACSGTAPSASAFVCTTSWDRKPMIIPMRQCGCFCWVPSHGLFTRAVNLKSCSAW